MSMLRENVHGQLDIVWIFEGKELQLSGSATL